MIYYNVRLSKVVKDDLTIYWAAIPLLGITVSAHQFHRLQIILYDEIDKKVEDKNYRIIFVPQTHKTL